MTKRVSLTPGASTKFDLAVAIDRDDESPRTLSNEWITIGSDKFQTRFNAPVIWERTTTGYRISDLRHDYISSALNILESTFLLQEPLCLATSLSKDIDSSKSFRRFVRKCMIEGNGVCAIHEGDGILTGLALLSERHKSEEENRDTQEGDALVAILALEKRLFDQERVKNTIEEVEKYLRIDVLFVRPDHRGKGVGTSLLRSCVAKSRSIGASAALGSFSSDIIQRIGVKNDKADCWDWVRSETARLGFEKLGQVPYETYIEENSQENPFVEIAQDNYSLACMIVKINDISSSTIQPSPTSRSASKQPTQS